MTHGKTIELFLVNGTADSLITAELSNWNGKAIKIPRIEVAECSRDDIKSAGVYFLFCNKENENGIDSVYIGESENIKERLVQHLRDYNSEKEEYYWNTAVVFIGRDLDKARIRYLENRFFELAKESNRYGILTKNTYKDTVIKESYKSSMEEFIDNVKIIINTLGYKVLEPLDTKRENISSDATMKGEKILGTTADDGKLYLKTKEADASGKVTAEGFVLLSGSKIAQTYTPSLNKNIKLMRDEILQSPKVEDFKTTEDILFSSPSAAAGFVVGYNLPGPASWKTKEGVALKELENKQIKC